MNHTFCFELGEPVRRLAADQRVFGRFLLRRRLGRGRFTVAWLAHDTLANSPIVLKFLPTALAADPQLLAELHAECAQLRTFRHPAIVTVSNLWTEPAMTALAVDWTEGRTLAELLPQLGTGGFEAEELAAFLGPVCEALDVGHRRFRSLHHDLRPAHLILGRVDEAKLLDWGVGAVLREAAARAGGGAAVLGVSPYQSPQQAMGAAPCVADDVYSLGATLYELLTGRPPFHTGDIAVQIRDVVPPTVTKRRRELGVPGAPVPVSWEGAIERCLEKDPARRPTSLRELSYLLGLADSVEPPPEVEGQTIAVGGECVAVAETGAGSAAPEAAAGGLRRFLRPLPLALGAGVLLLLALAPVWVWSMARRARQALPAAVAAPAPPPVATGGIVVRTAPDKAEVRVGTAVLQQAPVTVPGLAAGSYPVRVRLDGYEDWEGAVEVRPGEFAQAEVQLVPVSGTVEIASVPSGAEVIEEGRIVGKTPLRLERRPVGPVRYTLRLERFEDAEVSGAVARNSVLKLRSELARWLGPVEGEDWRLVGPAMHFVWIPRGGTELDWVDEGALASSWSGTTQALWLSATEVSQGQWRAIMRTNPSLNSGDLLPVENIDAKEAELFCRKLTERERGAGRLSQDYEYALPTGAEWEYACRAGSVRPDAGVLTEMGWWLFNSGYRTHEVGRKRPNAWGLYDMHGNVWELVAAGNETCYRGGGATSPLDKCDPAERIAREAGYKHGEIGFRVALRGVGTGNRNPAVRRR